MKFWKKFCIYSTLSILGLFALLIIALQCSWVQETSLKLALRSQFQEVRFKRYIGSSTSITADVIEVKNPNQSITIHQLNLQWTPWSLIFGRKLHIKNFQAVVSVDLKELLPEKVTHTSGLSTHSSKTSDTFSFFDSLKLPVKLDIESCDIHFEAHVPHIDVLGGHITLKNLSANNCGILEYRAQINTQIGSEVLSSHLEGNVKLKLNEGSNFTQIDLKGCAKLNKGTVNYPTIDYKGFLTKVKDSSNEHLQLNIVYGPNNEVSFIGETGKSANHLVNIKWNANLDQNWLQMLPLAHIPTVSIQSEGTCNLKRDTHLWQLNGLLNATAYNLYPEAINMPVVKGNAQFNAEFNAQQFTLNKCDALLGDDKEQGRIFFQSKIHHPLTYCYTKKVLQCHSKDHSPLVELKYQNLPFGFINPYLESQGHFIGAHITEGTIQVSFDDKKQEWVIDTTKPIAIYCDQININRQKLLTNTLARFKGKCAIKNDSSSLNYQADLTVQGNNEDIPFLHYTVKGEGYDQLKNPSYACVGDLDFNQNLAKSYLDLSSLKCSLNPELHLKCSHNFIYTLKTEQYGIFQFVCELYGNAKQNNWIVCKSLNSFGLFKGALISPSTTPLVQIQVNQCPLDLVKYQGIGTEGTLSTQGHIKSALGGFEFELTQPLKVDNFALYLENQEQLRLKGIRIDQLNCGHQVHKWHFGVKNLRIDAPQQNEPLLLVDADATGYDNQIQTTHGSVEAKLDALSVQPFALKYPGFFGNFQSKWQWEAKNKSADASAHLSLSSVPFDLSFKNHYTQGSKQSHQLDGSIVLKHENHTSDLNFQQTLTQQNKLSGKITSDKLWASDWMALVKYIQDALKTTQPKAVGSTVSNTSAVSTASTLKTPEAKAKFTLPIQGNIEVQLKSIPDLELQNFSSSINITPTVIAVKNFGMQCCDGNVQGHALYDLNQQHVEGSLLADRMQLSKMWNIPAYFQYPLSLYGQLSGTAGINADVKGDLEHLQNGTAHVSVQATNGRFIPSKTVSTGTQAVSGITSLLQSATDITVPGTGAIEFLSSYAKTIDFSKFALNLQRDATKPIVFQGNVTNADLAIDVDGQVSTDFSRPMNQQNLLCKVQFSAPQQSPFNDHFTFDANNRTELGYGIGPRCTIDGTLGKPNYGGLTELLNHAKLQPSKSKKEKATQKDSLNPINKIENLLKLF